jgi:hypothetical protein
LALLQGWWLQQRPSQNPSPALRSPPFAQKWAASVHWEERLAAASLIGASLTHSHLFFALDALVTTFLCSYAYRDLPLTSWQQEIERAFSTEGPVWSLACKLSGLFLLEKNLFRQQWETFFQRWLEEKQTFFVSALAYRALLQVFDEPKKDLSSASSAQTAIATLKFEQLTAQCMASSTLEKGWFALAFYLLGASLGPDAQPFELNLSGPKKDLGLLF